MLKDKNDNLNMKNDLNTTIIDEIDLKEMKKNKKADTNLIKNESVIKLINEFKSLNSKDLIKCKENERLEEYF